MVGSSGFAGKISIDGGCGRPCARSPPSISQIPPSAEEHQGANDIEQIDGKVITFWKKLSRTSGWRSALATLGLLAVFLAAMAWIQFSTPDMPDNDGFYHIRMAALMRQEGLKPSFPWLPLSVLNPGEFYDHHFLFHVGLIPFTWGDLRLGAKWGAVVFASLAFLAIGWLLRAQRVAYAPLWALGLLAVSQAFLFRMSITRAQSLSLGVLAVGMLLLFQRRYAWLLPLGFLYVWLYNAFPLLVALAGLYTLALWLTEHRLDLHPLLYSGLGVGLGLLLNPYFPADLVFIYHHYMPKLLDPTSVSVGSEWYPYDTKQLIDNSALALLAFVAGAFGLGMSGRRMDARLATTFLTATMFGVMLFSARRFIEYFPPFALIFAAFSVSAWLAPEGDNRPTRSEPAAADESPAVWDVPTRAPAGRRRRVEAWLHWSESYFPAALIALLAVGMFQTLPQARASVRSSAPYDLYASASAWLRDNTPQGERVFQTDWDDFPRLFFYNTHNTYLIGLDPTYMQLYDPALYDLWVRITEGQVGQPSALIRQRFGCGYAITDLDHQEFLAQASQDPGLEVVYRDNQAIVFRVR